MFPLAGSTESTTAGEATALFTFYDLEPDYIETYEMDILEQ